MNIDELKRIIAKWAREQPLIKKAYIFGSYARGDWRIDSDIDVAVEIEKRQNDENKFTTWIAEKGNLQDSLQKLLPIQLQLERYDIRETPTVKSGIERSSILIYSEIA